MEGVFCRLKVAGLKLNLFKCTWLRIKLCYLSHVVSEEGVATNHDKLNAVEAWHIPKSFKEVKVFLGTVGYYQLQFVEDFPIWLGRECSSPTRTHPGSQTRPLPGPQRPTNQCPYLRLP